MVSSKGRSKVSFVNKGAIEEFQTEFETFKESQNNEIEQLKEQLKKFQSSIDRKTEFGVDHANQLQKLFAKFDKLDEKEAEIRRKKK